MWSSLKRFPDLSYEVNGSRYFAGYGLQITAKPSKVKTKLSKRHTASIRLQYVALLGSWRPLEFFVFLV